MIFVKRVFPIKKIIRTELFLELKIGLFKPKGQTRKIAKHSPCRTDFEEFYLDINGKL